MTVASVIRRVVGDVAGASSGTVVSIQGNLVSVTTPSGVVQVTRGVANVVIGDTVRIQGGTVVSVITAKEVLPVFEV